MSESNPLYEAIKDGTKRFIQQVSESEDSDPPESVITEIQISEPEGGGEFATQFQPEVRTISHPSRKSFEYADLGEAVWSDLVKQISSGEERKEESGIDRYQAQFQELQSILMAFPWKVMDYTGGFEYSEAAFDAAFQDHLAESSDEYTTYKIVVPLLNVASTIDSLQISVEYPNHRPSQGNPSVIKSLEIAEFTESELSAICTYERYMPDPSRDLYPNQLAANLPSHKLLIEFDSIQDVQLGMDQATRIGDVVTPAMDGMAEEKAEEMVTALRLHKPTSSPAAGQPYFVISDWRTYRDDIRSTDVHRGFFSGYRPAFWNPELAGGNYELDEEAAEGFESFWDKYSEYIQLGSDHRYGSQLRRFNNTYQNSNPRDQIVDAVIAFETLLLKGCTIGGKTTTLSLIGSILLDQLEDESREDLRQYFRNLYDVRGKIVHYDKDWESIADGIDFQIFEDQPSKNEYADRTQELLAKTIRVYLDQMVERGTNIAETNSRIYQLMQNIDYPDD